jgi:hypothetical protein
MEYLASAFSEFALYSVDEDRVTDSQANLGIFGKVAFYLSGICKLSLYPNLGGA